MLDFSVLNYFAFATAKRATVLEFSTWAFVFVTTLAGLLIILARLAIGPEASGGTLGE
jgi:hypothetical protein